MEATTKKKKEKGGGGSQINSPHTLQTKALCSSSSPSAEILRGRTAEWSQLLSGSTGTRVVPESGWRATPQGTTTAGPSGYNKH